jgi:hypothetical protein
MFDTVWRFMRDLKTETIWMSFRFVVLDSTADADFEFSV